MAQLWPIMMLSLFSFFFLKKLSFQSFGKSKNAKGLSRGHNFAAILTKIFFFESFDLAKKVINMIKVCETDFQIRLVESKKHTIKSTFLVKSW